MYVILWIILAPLIAGLLLLQTCLRFYSEPGNRYGVVGVTLLALVIWAGASWVMGLFDFGVVWGLSHIRPPPSGHFPEGWLIYFYTAIYALFGLFLAAFMNMVPKRK
jgi:predicted Na+-dependent transporter